MEYTYIDRASETGFVKTALMAVLAVSLMPSGNHTIPQQISVSHEKYAETNTQAVIESDSHISEKEQATILLSFASKLAENTKDLDKDIAQIISNDFWEMYD